MIFNFYKFCTLAQDKKITVTKHIQNPKRTNGVGFDDDIIEDYTEYAQYVDLTHNHGIVTALFMSVNGVNSPVKVMYTLTNEESTRIEDYYEINFKEYNLRDLAEFFGWDEKLSMAEVEDFINNLFAMSNTFYQTIDGKKITQQQFSINHSFDKSNQEDRDRYYSSVNYRRSFKTFEELAKAIKEDYNASTTPPAGV